MAAASEWWRGGVIYQIYPRSFQDSNGDGIGDLAGVVQRLPYLAELGVDAIWLSPFFQSPMKDFGYDISDYRAVDPMFGQLADFDAVVAKAHALGIKVLIDQVLSHCSDQHPWFVESRSSRDNPRADWFVWADPKEDGTPPNNWLSIFGGSAWQWDTRRCQYYMHNFLTSQPDLNFHNPEVQQAALDNMQFWLDRGVDGFRLDAVNFCVHDKQLRSNPARGMPTDDPSVNKVNPYGWQRHQFDKSQPEMLDFLRRIRTLLNQYPDLMTVGEIGDDDTAARIAEYTGGGDKLHTAYSFDLLGPRCDASFVHSVVQNLEAVNRDGWACWALSNHDCVRVASRWKQPGDNRAWQRLVFAMQLSLRGSPCIYQGDELGLTEATLAVEDLQDPYGIAMWPEFVGRDGCRTPMAWDVTAANAGFSQAAKTWLPIWSEHLPLAAHSQMADPDSLFHFYKSMLAWRRGFEVLRTGSMELLAPHDQVLAFVRRTGDEALFCAFNMGAEAARYALPAGLQLRAVETPSGLPSGSQDGQDLVLPPYGVLFAKL